MVGLRHPLLQCAFFLKSSEQLLQIVLSQETLWNAAGNEMVIDVKSREEEESAANGPQWAEGRVLRYWDPFFASSLGNCVVAGQCRRASFTMTLSFKGSSTR